MSADLAIARRFGANLRQARKQADLSQEQLGFRASLHRTEIGLLERGARVARIDTLMKVAAGLAIRPEKLLEGIEWQQGSMERGGFKIVPGGES